MSIKDDYVAIDLPENHELRRYSNPEIAQKNAYQYLGKNATLYLARNPRKKYRVYDKDNKPVEFGGAEMEDFTIHGDEERRERYLKRSANIPGEWKNNKYSPNNLSRNILW